MHIIEKSILEACLIKLRAILLDAGLECGHKQEQAPLGFDAACYLPNEDTALLIDVKQSLQPYQVDKVALRSKNLLSRQKVVGQEHVIVFVSTMPRASLEKCVKSRICVLDEEGNGYIQLPGFYYHKYVSPKRGVSSTGVRRRAVFSSKASRLVRAMLVSYPESWSQTELADKVRVSPGYVSKVVSQMIDADYVRRENGKLRVVAPNRFLDDWAQVYRFDRHRRSRFAIGIGEYRQGLHKFGQEMQRQNIRFAYTGWSAAYLRSPHGMPDSIVAYVDRLSEDIPFRAIHPVESKGNVLLLLPHDEGVFQFSQPGEFGNCVADVQCYLDLLGLPGRASDQADALREKRLEFGEAMNG